MAPSASSFLAAWRRQRAFNERSLRGTRSRGEPLVGPTFFICAIGIIAWGVLGTVTSSAQLRDVSTVMELGGSRLSVSPDEMRALSDLGNSLGSKQKGVQDRALATARRLANSSDARYALSLYELEIGTRRGDAAMRAKALDVLIESELSPKSRLPGYLAARGQLAFQAGDFHKAEAMWLRQAGLAKNDPDVLANLAQARLALNDARGAFELLTRAIAMHEAARPGLKAPEVLYRQRLSIAQQGRLASAGIEAALAMVRAYPAQSNWRAALVVYRDLAAPAGSAEIDLLRLMRAAGVLAKPAEYQRFAQLLRADGEAMEARAVLKEGLAKGLLEAGTSPTREIIAEVDRALAGRPGHAVPKAELGTAGKQVRLGVAEFRSGRRLEAEAAFRAAAGAQAGGRYPEIAAFWLALLRQAGAGMGGPSPSQPSAGLLPLPGRERGRAAHSAGT